ncbi:MAG: HRDC domain-containing protein [Microbacteriaceae bacterium]
MEPTNTNLEVLSIEEEHAQVAVTDTAEGFAEALVRLRAGHGPIAMDAERASGYRYSQRPYLIQLFRRGSGVILLDPPAIGDLSAISTEFSDVTWILHAASQDLANLHEHGMHPGTIFDTELAAKLLGVERFGLAALLEQFLDIHLAKKFSAVDWSTRPLPDEWLIYAALDVEYLVDLTDLLVEQLIEKDRLRIAETEFAALLAREPKQNSLSEPWRKLSGIHQIKSRDQLALAQHLWLSRDALAQETDIAPGRLIPDRAIVAVALRMPKTFPEFMQFKEFNGRASRTEAKRWWAALQLAQKDKNKPELRAKGPDLPPIKVWDRHFPEAKNRFDITRPKILALAEELGIPQETLLTPEILRNLAFAPPESLSELNIQNALRELGARDWQISYTAPKILQGFVESLQTENVETGSTTPQTPKD